MAETGAALHHGSSDAPCSDVRFLPPDRNLGRPQGHPWVKIGETLLSRCTNAVDRFFIRTNLSVDDSHLLIAGSHMARFASWCEREEGCSCWQSIWSSGYLLHALVAAQLAIPTLFVHQPITVGHGCSMKARKVNATVPMARVDEPSPQRHELVGGVRPSHEWEQQPETPYVRASIFQRMYARGEATAGSTSTPSRPLLSGAQTSFWDPLSTLNLMRVLCTSSADAPPNTLVLHKPVASDPDALPTASAEWSDTPAGGLTILEIQKDPLERTRALERVLIRAWAPACNIRRLYKVGKMRPRRIRKKPQARLTSHLRAEDRRQISPLGSPVASTDKELIRWQERPLLLAYASAGPQRPVTEGGYYRQSIYARLAAGLGPGPSAMTINLPLSAQRVSRQPEPHRE